MENIYSYLEENSEEYQFSLDNLLNQIDGDYRPHIKTVKTKLLQKYGDVIFIAVTANKPPIVCFRNTGYKLLTETWYKDKKLNPKEERLRIIKAAATIVLEDIRSQVYEISHYPPSDSFLQEVDTVIPETLQVLLQDIVLKHKYSSLKKWKTKCTAFARAIISAVRPRSFLSGLQVGLAAFLYRKFGSRKLLEVLSSLGFSASYSEVGLFEVSAIMRPAITIQLNAFSEFVFDNADFNTHTTHLDGLSTSFMHWEVFTVLRRKPRIFRIKILNDFQECLQQQS